MLNEKLRVGERLAGTQHARGRDEGAEHRLALSAANLRLDAHRQVFEMFIQAFTTYRPILRRIKDSYDEVLDDGLRASHENIVMRAELAVAEQRKFRAVESARADAAANATAMLAELFSRLVEAQDRAEKAGKHEERLEKNVKELQGTVTDLRAQLAEVRRQNDELRALMQTESTFAKSTSSTMASVKVGGGRGKKEKATEEYE